MNLEIKSRIELYGPPIDIKMSEPVECEGYEQMRCDLMIAVGMLMALNAGAKP